MAKAKAQAPAEGTKVRVLVEGVHGKPNDVAVLDGQALKDALNSGEVDDHPDAVAYAESLEQNQRPAAEVVHEAEE